MTLTIGLMAGAALLIAVCPTYSKIGIAAPVVLLLARLVQGFSAGGEFGTSSAFLVESAAPGRRAFAGSWQQVSVGAGTLIASLLGTILTSTLDSASLQGWGWRLAFGVGALLGLVGLWLRLSAPETESFTRLESTRKRNPLKTMVLEHPGAALRVAGITIAGTLTYYVWVSYLPSYAHVTTGIPLKTALLANTIGLVVFLILLPFGALLSDKVGRKPTLLAFAIGFAVLAWPLMNMLGNSFWSVFVVELIGLVLLVGYSANCAVVMAEQFPPEVRTTGIALPYALAVAIFGGTAPYVTTWMSTAGHRDLVWVYLLVAAVIGVLVYATMPETKGKELK
jgi:MHS family alpha-ketoglutarate permease-like MFS transporter